MTDPRRRTEYVRIRVTPDEKAEIERRAAEAGLGVGPWLLAMALPDLVREDGRTLRWKEEEK